MNYLVIIHDSYKVYSPKHEITLGQQGKKKKKDTMQIDITINNP